jgi:hypothetical protein
MKSEQPTPRQESRLSPNTTTNQSSVRCPVKGCNWRGACPVHGAQAIEPSRASDRLVRQRPNPIARGGGWTVRCQCGAWVSPRTTRGHLLCLEVA